MNEVTLFPYPYKVAAGGEVKDGFFYCKPAFCRRYYNTKKCRDHYLEMFSSPDLEFKECPYGFASKAVEIDGYPIVGTCLNIETYSNKKAIQKRLTNKDYSPRFSVQHFDNVIENINTICKSEKEFHDSIASNELSFSTIEEQKELLNNTFHELRKLNQQLKNQAELLIYKSNNATEQDITRLQYLSQNIFSTSQLISIRLNTYDFGVNPELILREHKGKVQIHNKFHKVSQCLREYANKNHLRIEFGGESYSCVYANDVIELLPYLLLDNAIKYSHPNKKIFIQFDEYENQLQVLIKGLSIRPQNHEIKQLFERGIRSEKVEEVQGQGIGLFLAKYICDIHNIDISIKVGDVIEYYNGRAYSDFTVKLIFNDIVSEEE